ncbi:hypothetical protein SUGI_1105160 [Cryptomeria japonica]|nr:hypothetical protein SUGI_1105160 [Cryptomeria japonica]
MAATSITKLIVMHFVVVGFVVCNLFSIQCNANAGDALIALRSMLHDPHNALESWDPTLVNPCTWSHVTCDKPSWIWQIMTFLVLSHQGSLFFPTYNICIYSAIR